MFERVRLTNLIFNFVRANLECELQFGNLIFRFGIEYNSFHIKLLEGVILLQVDCTEHAKKQKESVIRKTFQIITTPSKKRMFMPNSNLSNNVDSTTEYD